MLKLHNSLTRRKEEFEPLNESFAGVYVCGPTVYGHSHLGHGKSYVSFDVLIRYLRYSGFRVRYVQNLTDVGHHVDDLDYGEDKVQKQARIEKLEPMEVAEKYIRSFFEDMDAMGLLRPDISPRASGHIPEQIALVESLLEKGHGYEVNGNVYFSVESFPGYGSLSGRKIDDLVSGARVEVETDKRDPRDFALWKDAGQSHILRWKSPWGWGYPGWHLECSAMAMRYLGETIDIHCGGLENIFPHHDSEIAQSEAATGKRFARFWLHNNMVTVDGQKMGKSLGNYTLLKDLFEKYDPMVVKLYILRSHYRSPLDFCDEGLSSARSGFERLVSFRSRLGSPSVSDSPSDAASELASGTESSFLTAMDDDLNTPTALASLFDMVRAGNSLLDERDEPADRALLARVLDGLAEEILGLELLSGSGKVQQAGVCEVMTHVRGVLRRNRLFSDADLMRSELEELGYVVKDLPDGESEVHPR